ncbi:unnamed protein product [Discula destructiva]
MFSSSVAGASSVCLGCQLRAVTRRNPVLAAGRSAAAAAAQSRIRRQQRRYASNSADDPFESVLSSQRHGGEYDELKPKKKAKRKPPQQVKSRDEKAPFVRTFNDRSLREGTYTQPEVTFEDVWDQGQDLELEVEKQNKGRSGLAPVQENPGEIDYGSTTHDEAPAVGNFSWVESEAEIRERFAEYRKHPRKAEASRPPPPPSRYERPAGYDKKLDRSGMLKHGRQDQRLKPNLVRQRKPPAPPPTQPTDNLFGWDRGSFAGSGLEHRSIWSGNETDAQDQGPQDPFADFGAPSEEHEEVQEPVKNVYRKGGMRMVEDISKLSIETLGKDAGVIVLKEDGRWERKPFKRDRRPPEPTFKVEDNVDQEEGLGLDVVLDNIDGLRPTHRILPAREFKVIFDQLLKGFTAFQLETYVERDRKRLDEGDERPFLGVIPDELPSRPWIVSQTRWTPEVHGAVEGVDHPLKGYILRTMPPKQRLVMQLMRECWNMSVQELLDGHGVLDIQLRDQEFKLLTLANQRFLARFSRVHLSQGGGKAIEVVKSRKALRIVAPKTTAESCLKAMHETVQKIKTKSVSLINFPASRLTADVLEDLSQLTNTIVELDETRHELKVTWIDVADRYNSKLEDLSEVVLRLIFTSRPLARTGKALAVYPDPPEQGTLIEDTSNREKLSWIDRRASWARLCLPLATKTQQQQQQQQQLARRWPLGESMLKYKVEPVTDDFVDRKPAYEVAKAKEAAFFAWRSVSMAGVPLGFPRPRQYSEEELLEEIIQPTKPTSSGWLPFRTRTNAVFGHVLHLNHENAANPFQKGDIAALAASRRALTPLIPPITEMHLPGWVPYTNPSNMTSLIVVRFIPTLKNPVTTEPTLELRLTANDEEIISIDSLRAIAHTHVADVCLPGEHVDARLTQRLFAELPGAVLDSTPGMKPLLQFLHDSILEPGQGRLVTPSVLDGLGLPSWLFYAPETDVQSPFLHSHSLAELRDANKAATATATSDSSEPPTTKKSRKSKKPSNPATDALAVPAHNPYLPPANVLTPTSYLFAGLEVHRPFETAYDGWQLAYTSIEAGAGGGRRAELTLSAQPAADKALRRKPDAVTAGAWLRSVYRLATGRVVTRPRGGEEQEQEEQEYRPDDEGTKGVVRWLGNKH